MDQFKCLIDGYRGAGHVCPCCNKGITKVVSHRKARRILKHILVVEMKNDDSE